MENDKLILGGHEFNSRFILGSGKYSLDLIKAAVENAGAEIITLALRRAVTGKVANILDYLHDCPLYEAVTSGGKDYLLLHSGLDKRGSASVPRW